MRTRRGAGLVHDSRSSARCASTAAATRSVRARERRVHAVAGGLHDRTAVRARSRPGGSRRGAPARRASSSGCSSHRRVEPSRSVNRNVTVPVGSDPIGRPLVARTLSRSGHSGRCRHRRVVRSSMSDVSVAGESAELLRDALVQTKLREGPRWDDARVDVRGTPTGCATCPRPDEDRRPSCCFRMPTHSGAPSTRSERHQSALPTRSLH